MVTMPPKVRRKNSAPDIFTRRIFARVRNLLAVTLAATALIASAQPSFAIDPRDSNEQNVSNQRRAQPPAARSTPPVRRSAAQPGPWLIDYSTESAWFIDQTQVQVSGTEARAWISIIYSGASEGAAYSRILYLFDCSQRRYRMVDGAFYSADGNSLGPVSPTAFGYAIPDSMADIALTVGCTDFSAWDTALGLARVPAGLTVFEAAANIFSATAPRLSTTFLQGSWSQNNNCSEALHLFSNGTFTLSGASSYGNWRLDGDQLTLSANGQTLRSQVELLDANRIQTRMPGGDFTILRRC